MKKYWSIIVILFVFSGCTSKTTEKTNSANRRIGEITKLSKKTNFKRGKTSSNLAFQKRFSPTSLDGYGFVFFSDHFQDGFSTVFFFPATSKTLADFKKETFNPINSKFPFIGFSLNIEEMKILTKDGFNRNQFPEEYSFYERKYNQEKGLFSNFHWNKIHLKYSDYKELFFYDGPHQKVNQTANCYTKWVERTTNSRFDGIEVIR